MYKFKYGFSMVELMLLLLIASLILAATVPVITKKHLHLPFSTNHGSYICYYDQEGKLHEDRKSGKITQKSLAGYPRRVNQCVFEPPAKAVMFQVTAIGGGGGGGDAGYEPSEPETVINPDAELPLFGSDNNGITEDDLLNKIGLDTGNQAWMELADYSGNAWFFAQGADSGDAGYIWQTKLNVKKRTNTCPPDKVIYKTGTKTKYVGTNYEWCTKVPNSRTKVTSTDYPDLQGTIYDCYKDGSIVGGYVTYKDSNGNLPTKQCTGVETNKNTTCKYVDKDGHEVSGSTYKYDCEVKKLKRTIPHAAEYKTDGSRYISGYGEKPEIPCTNPCQYLGQTNCNSGPCYGEAPIIYGTCDPGNTKTQCKIKDAWTEYEYENVWTVNGCTASSTCIPQNNSSTTNKSWTETAPSDIKYQTTSGSGVTCTKREGNNNSFEGTVALTYDYEYPDGCSVEDLGTTDYGEYSIVKYPSNLTSYYKGGKGQFCAYHFSSPIYYLIIQDATEAFGSSFAYSTSQNFNSIKPQLVTDINKGMHSSNNKSFCPGTEPGLGSCGPSEGNVFKDSTGNPTYAEVLLSAGSGSLSLKSYSSSTAAKGDTLKQVCTELDEYDGLDGSGQVQTKKVKYCYDEVVTPSTGKNGDNGTCSFSINFGNNTQTDTEIHSYEDLFDYDMGLFTDSRLDCRKGKDQPRAGYCLAHWYNGENYTKAELNGSYKYHDSYETNTLKRGLPGQSGEYKTIILRSMKDIDTTITVGRGGTGATIKSGDDGAHGDSTSFGTLLLAKGGDGGAGNQLINEKSRLPKYDRNATGADFDMVRRCFNDQLQEGDNQATCNQWKADPSSLPYYKNTAGDSGEPPVRKSAGGIFNFILAALGLNNNETVMDIMEFSGRGGQGGGVQHFCWAGKHIVTFDKRELCQSSVYHADKLPTNTSDSYCGNIPEEHKIPTGCRAAYDHVQAGDGYDGALIITW